MLKREKRRQRVGAEEDVDEGAGPRQVGHLGKAAEPEVEGNEGAQAAQRRHAQGIPRQAEGAQAAAAGTQGGFADADKLVTVCVELQEERRQRLRQHSDLVLTTAEYFKATEAVQRREATEAASRDTELYKGRQRILQPLGQRFVEGVGAQIELL